MSNLEIMADIAWRLNMANDAHWIAARLSTWEAMEGLPTLTDEERDYARRKAQDLRLHLNCLMAMQADAGRTFRAVPHQAQENEND